MHDRYLKVIDDYTKTFATLTDEHAKQLLDEWLTADADRVKLRRDYVPKFAEVLSGRKLSHTSTRSRTRWTRSCGTISRRRSRSCSRRALIYGM